MAEVRRTIAKSSPVCWKRIKERGGKAPIIELTYSRFAKRAGMRSDSVRKALKRLEEYGLISPQTEKKKGLRKMRYLITGANLLRECALETTVDHQVLADLASHHAFRYGTKIESLLKEERKENKEALSPKVLALDPLHHRLDHPGGACPSRHPSFKRRTCCTNRHLSRYH